MRKTDEQRLDIKRKAWLERTMLAVGVGDVAARKLLSQERHQSVRLNQLVADPEETLAQLAVLGWRGRPYDWAVDCYSIDEGMTAVRDSAVVASGGAFIQNAASWLPVIALNPRPGERILDVCAAPGGKASHIAALTDNQARLWVNDNSRPRLAKMRANFTRLGVTPEDTTLFDAAQLARKLDGQQFDKILLDAPCSGEGLMRYDEAKDFSAWSVAHIKRLQQLQKRMLSQAWQLLSPGGMLVYSTCTMAPEENEAVVDYLLRTQPDAAINPCNLALPNRIPTVKEWNGKLYRPDVQDCIRLIPSSDIEAFFVCTFTKLAEQDSALYSHTVR